MAKNQEWTPNVGEIVLTAFPSSEGDKALDKVRCCLIVGARRTTRGWMVRVAYGTSQHLLDIEPGDFVLDPAEAGFDVFRKSGLHCATKFRLSRSVELPLTEEWFRVPYDRPYGETPKVGVLADSFVLSKVRPAIEAMRVARFAYREPE